MKTQLKYLPILTVLALTAVSLKPAYADHNSARGARWVFDPQTIRSNGPSLPADNFEPTAPPPLPHSVQSGSVPRGGSFLGLDDPRLKTAPPVVAPIARSSLMPVITSTKAVPTNNMNTPFHASFGKPITPPVMANLPKTAVPLAIPQNAAKPAVAKGLSSKPSTGANKSLHGTLLTPQKRTVKPSAARALALNIPKVESYGKNVGYTPGAFLPTASGSSSSSRTDVYGKVLKTHMGR